MKTNSNYSSKEINKAFLIKVSGVMNNVKYNTLVGISGLQNIVGEARAAKLFERAMKSTTDVCRCKVYGGVQVSFYLH